MSPRSVVVFLMGEPSERFKCFKTDSNYFNEFEA